MAPRPTTVRARSGEPLDAHRENILAVASSQNGGVSSSDHIVNEIMRGLYEGRYVPGQKLTEGELSRRFEVGRGSVREALKRLAAEGIVTMSLHRGASIRALSRQETRDVLEIIEALATLAARRAAERLSTAADTETLRNALNSLTAVTSGPNSFEVGRLRDRFYRQLAQISGNQELVRLIPAVQAHLIRIQFRAAYDADKLRDKDYARIVEAVLAKDGTAAERIMRQHIRRTAGLIDALPDDVFAF